jgi:cyclophilin family peptidyl-prolyl cis-trans isomerase
MARWDEPQSATSEFFVNLNNNTNLDKTGDYGWALGFAVWGEVVSGFDVAEAISALPTKEGGGMKMLVEPVVYTAAIEPL